MLRGISHPPVPSPHCVKYCNLHNVKLFLFIYEFWLYLFELIEPFKVLCILSILSQIIDGIYRYVAVFDEVQESSWCLTDP